MAGIIKILNVFDLGGGKYSLSIEPNDGIFVGETLCDNNGFSYLISVVDSSSKITVSDVIYPDSPRGKPVVGTGCTYLPTPNIRLSQTPFASPGWDEVLRTDFRRLDLAFASISGSIPELTQDQIAALQGTAGTPSVSNKFVTDSDARLGGGLNADIIDALQGTFGSPSDANRFTTDSDPRNTNSRTPSGIAGGQLSGAYPNPNVIGITESSGPTNLTVGSIPDGQIVARSGSLLVGTNISSSQVMVWGAENIGSSGSDTRFLPPGWGSGLVSNSDFRQIIIPRSGTFRNMYVRHNQASGNGELVNYRLRVNGVDTALTASLASGAIGTASNLVNTVAVSQGDLVGIVAVKVNGIGNGNQSSIVSLEFV